MVATHCATAVTVGYLLAGAGQGLLLARLTVGRSGTHDMRQSRGDLVERG